MAGQGGRPRWQRWCTSNNNRTHKLLCNYFKILRRVYAAIRRASRDGTYSQDVQSLSPLLSSFLLHSFASFLFPFEVAFLQKLDCEGGEGINCRSCARANLFKKQKKERVSPSGRESRSMRRGVLARGGIRISIQPSPLFRILLRNFSLPYCFVTKNQLSIFDRHNKFLPLVHLSF